MKVIFKSLLLTKALKKGIEGQIQEISENLLKEVRRRSPVRSGLFKKSWRMSGSGNKRTVSNSQTYGHALEHGKSGQAPDGIVGPSIRAIKK
tara:strand:+ start:206 stop:481 length:276 start_codon:yes stop_codon:yes gene_type:complete